VLLARFTRSGIVVVVWTSATTSPECRTTLADMSMLRKRGAREEHEFLRGRNSRRAMSADAFLPEHTPLTNCGFGNHVSRVGLGGRTKERRCLEDRNRNCRVDTLDSGPRHSRHSYVTAVELDPSRPFLESRLQLLLGYARRLVKEYTFRCAARVHGRNHCSVVRRAHRLQDQGVLRRTSWQSSPIVSIAVHCEPLLLQVCHFTAKAVLRSYSDMTALPATWSKADLYAQ
jgi:hypothetical protein